MSNFHFNINYKLKNKADSRQILKLDSLRSAVNSSFQPKGIEHILIKRMCDGKLQQKNLMNQLFSQKSSQATLSKEKGFYYQDQHEIASVKEFFHFYKLVSCEKNNINRQEFNEQLQKKTEKIINILHEKSQSTKEKERCQTQSDDQPLKSQYTLTNQSFRDLQISHLFNTQGSGSHKNIESPILQTKMSAFEPIIDNQTSNDYQSQQNVYEFQRKSSLKTLTQRKFIPSQEQNKNSKSYFISRQPSAKANSKLDDNTTNASSQTNFFQFSMPQTNSLFQVSPQNNSQQQQFQVKFKSPNQDQYQFKNEKLQTYSLQQSPKLSSHDFKYDSNNNSNTLLSQQNIKQVRKLKVKELSLPDFNPNNIPSTHQTSQKHTTSTMSTVQSEIVNNQQRTKFTPLLISQGNPGSIGDEKNLLSPIAVKSPIGFQNSRIQQMINDFNDSILELEQNANIQSNQQIQLSNIQNAHNITDYNNINKQQVNFNGQQTNVNGNMIYSQINQVNFDGDKIQDHGREFGQQQNQILSHFNPSSQKSIIYKGIMRNNSTSFQPHIDYQDNHQNLRENILEKQAIVSFSLPRSDQKVNKNDLGFEDKNKYNPSSMFNLHQNSINESFNNITRGRIKSYSPSRDNKHSKTLNQFRFLEDELISEDKKQSLKNFLSSRQKNLQFTMKHADKFLHTHDSLAGSKAINTTKDKKMQFIGQVFKNAINLDILISNQLNNSIDRKRKEIKSAGKVSTTSKTSPKNELNNEKVLVFNFDEAKSSPLNKIDSTNKELTQKSLLEKKLTRKQLSMRGLSNNKEQSNNEEPQKQLINKDVIQKVLSQRNPSLTKLPEKTKSQEESSKQELIQNELKKSKTKISSKELSSKEIKMTQESDQDTSSFYSLPKKIRTQSDLIKKIKKDISFKDNIEEISENVDGNDKKPFLVVQKLKQENLINNSNDNKAIKNIDKDINKNIQKIDNLLAKKAALNMRNEKKESKLSPPNQKKRRFNTRAEVGKYYGVQKLFSIQKTVSMDYSSAKKNILFLQFDNNKVYTQPQGFTNFYH